MKVGGLGARRAESLKQCDFRQRPWSFDGPGASSPIRSLDRDVSRADAQSRTWKPHSCPFRFTWSEPRRPPG